MHLFRNTALLFTFLFSLHAIAAVTPVDLAKGNMYSDAKLSPDGTKLAVAVVIDGLRRIAVFDVATFENIGGASLGGSSEVGEYFWANNERLVMEVWVRRPWKEQPDDYGELFAVNYDGGRPEMIYGIRAGADEMTTGKLTKGKEDTRGWASIIHMLPDDKDNILITNTPMSRDGSNVARVHRINIYNGHMSRKITTAPVQFARFITDSKGELKIVTGVDENNNQRTFKYTGDGWEEISATLGDEFVPLALNNDETSLYFLDNYKKDKQGLHELNLSTGERKEIYTDSLVDVSGINFTADKSSVYALRTDEGYPSYMVFNSAGEEAKLFKTLLSTFSGYRVTVTSRSEDGKLSVIYVSNDIDAGTFYLFDQSTNNLKMLFANMDHIDIEQMAESTPVSFAARDGATVYGYLTYPMNMAENAKVPLVTLVHGGPHGVRDYWVFDREVQLLAAQGYAVLRVNYRGSEGYGLAYESAGYRHWGDLIQQDIIDGTKWAIGQGHIDSGKVCLMGASFGGYSSVMSATLEQDLFKCVVANAGVYDLKMMWDEGDTPDVLFGKSYLNRVIGTEETQLQAFSPVNRVANLQAPLLIAHGERDRRVPFEQAKSLEKALKAHNKTYETFYKSTESHGFFDEQNRAEYFNAVVTFLNKYLK